MSLWLAPREGFSAHAGAALGVTVTMTRQKTGLCNCFKETTVRGLPRLAKSSCHATTVEILLVTTTPFQGFLLHRRCH